ncbi:acyltransferase [Arcicella aquatica]|uniref:Acyltransferase n=1 Tax=Arcicella aquatica TaxID=217141 RepID=A0ABU5QPM5_9BACT|nr:acyltransferase [Arcicella aquatica]MEA5258845.1 acyltransferase [Arcicella aquatica]
MDNISLINSKKETYFSQLDGIRFLAVMLVLIDHWMAERNPLPLGHLGVTMFFVLSGFLITRILIQSKLKDDRTGRSHWFSVKQFIVRRSIRIFPIYFLSIFALYYFNIPPVRETLIWCLTYSTNLYIAINQHWMGTIDHLWSLAVEEQYYLVFPYLILFLPTRHYLKLLGAMIVIAIATRLWLYFNGTPWLVQYVLMPTALDCFGLGGLMAYYFTFKKNEVFDKLAQTKFIILSFIAYAICVSLIIIQQKTTGEVENFGKLVTERFLGATFCFFLIAKAISEYKGFLKWFFEQPIVQYLGRISYGIYLYHNFVYNFYHTPQTSIVLRGLHKIQRMFPLFTLNIGFEFLYFLGITVFIATLSWFIIEKPINHLKKYFTY